MGRARFAAAVVGPPLAVAVALAAWGTLVEPRLLDRRDEIGWVPGLARAWDGQRLALFSDPQVGLWLGNVDTVRRAVHTVVRERPALALIAGDFVYNAARRPERAVDQVVDVVRPLAEAGIASYAVLGNHDYAEEGVGSGRQAAGVARALRQQLERGGIRVLHNEAVALPAPRGEDSPVYRSGGEDPPLYLVGIGPRRVGEDRPLQALAQVPEGAPRLVLMHNPRSFAELPARSAPLALAGHTHGGQIRLPFKPEWTLARLRKRWPQYAEGWIDGERFGRPGNKLYVNRGLGFSMIPVRLGCPPELTFFTLRAPA